MQKRIFGNIFEIKLNEIMKYIITAFMAMMLILTSEDSFCQFNDTEDGENESGESIMQREQFIYTRRAGGPGKLLPKNAYEKAFSQKQRMVKDENLQDEITSSTSWASINPAGMFYQFNGSSYISGRTNSIAFHPTDTNTIYIAAAQGGVWKTTDGGLNWIVLTDTLGSISSGDVTIDISNPDILYYGTGELNYSQDSQYGAGIYKSADGGLSWNKIASASEVGNRISKILTDPVNSNNVYTSTDSGFFRSTNAGLSWNRTLILDASSLIMSPVNSQILYISSGARNQSKIYKSDNGGLNWTQLANGLPATAGRIQLAVSPDNENYIYASIANTSGTLNGLYRTTNAGTNWTLMNSTTNYMSSQGWYDNAVTVVPGNPDKVIVGGLDIYTSTNGGTTLTKKTVWSTTSSSNFSHADIHYLSYRGSVLYCCSDGGVYRSYNDATSWSDLNLNISTLQFMSADYDPSNIQKVYGGTQDNNKQTTTNSGVVWIQRTTGDGGYTVVDPVSPNYVYGQYVNGSVQRSSNSGVSFSEFRPSGSSGGLFYNPYEMAPGNPNTIVYGAANVYKTTSAKTATSSSGWTQIGTTSVIGGNVSAIGISYTDINKIYIGTSNGRILATTNNGTNWSLTSGYSYVSDFWVDSANSDVCYASFGGTTSNVRKTTDGGISWTVISSNLPAIGVNSIVVKMSSPRTIFTGTDLGVFKSTDEGANWISFNTGFPNVEVYDLKYKESAKILLAATHGRGCFMFDFGNTNRNLNLTMSYQFCQFADSLTAELRASTFPYNVIDSKYGYAGQGIPFQISFAGALNGVQYYIALRHKNSIETWSKTAQMFSGNTLNYDFTSSDSKAYGNNQILNQSGMWSLYQGDLNQDGFIDAADLSGVENDAVSGIYGSGLSDLNCDGIVDASDLSSIENNIPLSVQAITP